MKTKIKKFICILFAGILCLNLLGCGDEKTKNGGKQDAEEEEYAYLADWITVDTSYPGGFITAYLLDKDCLYYSIMSDENGNMSSHIGSINILTEKEPAVLEQGNGIVADLFADTQGDLWCVRNDSNDEKDEWFIEKVNLPGIVPEAINISKSIPEGNFVQRAVIDEEGNLYLQVREEEAGTNSIQVLNPEGESLYKIENLDFLTSMQALKGKEFCIAASVWKAR